MILNHRIGGVYQYRTSGKKFILKEVRGYVYEFECGHWVTDSVFGDMLDAKTGMLVSEDRQLKMDM